MDVNKKNFSAVLKALDDDLRDASFLSIDAEFTGLKDGSTKFSSLDTPSERYDKIYNSSLRFLVIQFGLSIFQFDSSKSKYVNKTYNFYIFPNSNSSGQRDNFFLSQASSIAFLASQGFDFNKLIKEGIPFLNPVEEEKLKLRLEKASNKPRWNNRTTHELNGAQPLDSVKSEVPSQLNSSESDSPVKETTEITDNSNNSNNQSVIDNYAGFSRVIQKIGNSGKTVVGHNMLLDLCHLLHQFLGPLPDDYSSFKALSLTHFKRLIDTKVMATTNPLRDLLPNSTLEPLCSTLMKSPFKMVEIETSPGFPSYSMEHSKSHEAGFDAYMTGLCFISMCSFLESTATDGSLGEVHNSPFIEPFVNKIHLQMVTDIPYINLSGPDLEPDRDHVFFVTFPSDWKLNDIFLLFQQHGPVRVDWMGDTAAFVSLQRRANKSLVLSGTPMPLGTTIKSYATYLKDSAKQVTQQDITRCITLKKRKVDDDETSTSPQPSKSLRSNPTSSAEPISSHFSVPDNWE